MYYNFPELRVSQNTETVQSLHNIPGKLAGKLAVQTILQWLNCTAFDTDSNIQVSMEHWIKGTLGLLELGSHKTDWTSGTLEGDISALHLCEKAER